MRPRKVERPLIDKAKVSEDIYKHLSDSEINLIKAIEIAKQLEEYSNRNSLDRLSQDSLEARESCEKALEFVGRLKNRFHLINSAGEAS